MVQKMRILATVNPLDASWIVLFKLPFKSTEVNRLLLHWSRRLVYDHDEYRIIDESWLMKESSQTLLGQQIGNIRVVDVLGEGGMGAVYIGFDDTLQRKVAVKAIHKEYRLNPEAKARFLREARLLSQLDHPNVCRVHEFIEKEEMDLLVLELIEGHDLSRRLRDGLSFFEKLSIARQLLDVLVAVHEKGVMHRDLKPENVMILPDGGIKVLDFGLARSLDEEAVISAVSARPLPEMEVGKTVVTSPKASAEGHSPDSEMDGKTIVRSGDSCKPERTDIESGRTVVTDQRTSGPARASDVHAGFDTKPAPIVKTMLGTVMGTLGYMSPEQARGEPASAASDVFSAGIMLQELFTEKLPFDLRESPEELIRQAAEGDTLPVEGIDDDLCRLIERMKAHAPGARPSSFDAAESLDLIIGKPKRQRKKRILISAWIVLIVLVTGMAIQTYRASRATLRAEQEAATATEISDFLIGLFDVSNPLGPTNKAVTARELLDKGAERIEVELADQPEVRAKLTDVLGRVYFRLGYFATAQTMFEKTIELNEATGGKADAAMATNLQHLGMVFMRQDRLDEAQRLLDSALEIAEANLGPTDLDVGEILMNIAVIHAIRGEVGAAISVGEQALYIFEVKRGPDSAIVGRILSNLGFAYSSSGLYEKAQSALRRSLRILEDLKGDDYPEIAHVVSNLANIEEARENFDEAEELYLRALNIREKTLGPDNPFVAVTQNEIARLEIVSGNPKDAAPLLDRALSIAETSFGPDHQLVGEVMTMTGRMEIALGRSSEAREHIERARTILEESIGADNPEIAPTLHVFGLVEAEDGNLDEATILLERGLQLAEQAGGSEHPQVGEVLRDLGRIYQDQGRNDEAKVMLDRADMIREKILSTG